MKVSPRDDMTHIFLHTYFELLYNDNPGILLYVGRQILHLFSSQEIFVLSLILPE